MISCHYGSHIPALRFSSETGPMAFVIEWLDNESRTPAWRAGTAVFAPFLRTENRHDSPGHSLSSGCKTGFANTTALFYFTLMSFSRMGGGGFAAGGD